MQETSSAYAEMWEGTHKVALHMESVLRTFTECVAVVDSDCTGGSGIPSLGRRRLAVETAQTA